MIKVRIGYGMTVVATAIMFLFSGSYFVGGIFFLEVLLTVVLRLLLRFETAGLEIEMHVRPACRLGQTIPVNVTVKGKWRYLATARIQGDISGYNRLFHFHRRVPVEADARMRLMNIELPWNPEMCGSVTLGLENLYCYDIFGLNCVKIATHQLCHLTVYPKKVPVHLVPANEEQGHQKEGLEALSRKGNDATEVFELREYQPGDSIRSIHWKLSEKFGTVLVREPSDTSHYDILIFFDAGLSLEEKDREPKLLSAAMSMASSVSEKLMEHKVPHYMGMWAADKMFISQVTARQEYESTMDTWMNLSLPEKGGIGLKCLIAEKSHSNYRRILYFTTGVCPDEIYELAKDVNVTAVCISGEEGKVKTTKRGMCVLMELPYEQLEKNTQNIVV